MNNRDEVRLRHMLDAARKAIAFTQDRERTDLDTDEMLALAVVRLVEILGKPQKTFLKRFDINFLISPRDK
jgi:uncharacterized protein with HEPN domain